MFRLFCSERILGWLVLCFINLLFRVLFIEQLFEHSFVVIVFIEPDFVLARFFAVLVAIIVERAVVRVIFTDWNFNAPTVAIFLRQLAAKVHLMLDVAVLLDGKRYRCLIYRVRCLRYNGACWAFPLGYLMFFHQSCNEHVFFIIYIRSWFWLWNCP